MTIIEPLPSGGYGKADWVDYSNYWRELDAEWIMERSILRYVSASLRATQWPDPKYGQTTYNEASDKLEMFSKSGNEWGTVLSYVNLTSTVDSTAAVGMSHRLAGGKGIVIQPSQTLFDNPVNMMGTLSVDATGATVKLGTNKAVKLTTNATSLVSDSPISAPGGSLTGALTGTSVSLSGSLTGVSATMSGTLTGGVVNGTTGVIGGVSFGSNRATADAGFASQFGFFTGDGSSAYMRMRNPSTGVVGTSFVQVGASAIDLNGPATNFRGPTNVMGGQGMRWYNAAGAATAWISPTIYAATDPGAANFPDGTIWIS